MIQALITYLNAKLTLTGYFDTIFELSELVKNAEGKTAPRYYCANDEFKDLSNYDFSYGQSYWRKSGDVSLSIDNTVRNGILFRIPLKLVCFIPKSKIIDDAYSDERVAQTLIKQLTTNNTGLRNLIKAKRINIIPSSYSTDNQAILNNEYSGYKLDIRHNFAYLSVDFDIEVLSTKECIDTECNIDSDILHIFDFCDTSVIGRLTQTQLDCLREYFGAEEIDYDSFIDDGTTINSWIDDGTLLNSLTATS